MKATCVPSSTAVLQYCNTAVLQSPSFPIWWACFKFEFQTSRFFLQLVGDLSELREKDYADLKQARVQQQQQQQQLQDSEVSKGNAWLSKNASELVKW